MPGLMKNINQIACCAEQYRADRLAPLGLTGCQYSYILNVCKHPGVFQEQLAKLICVNKSTVARQLAQLEESGFIRRESNEKDRRAVAVFPTEKAEQCYPLVRRAVREWSRYITAGLEEEEKEVLFVILEKMKRRAADYLENGQIDDCGKGE